MLARLSAVVAIVFALWVGAGAATAQVTYNVSSSNATFVLNNTTCTVGTCGTYTLANQTTGSITFAGPLAPNLANSDIGLQITGYTLTDGQRTFTFGAPGEGIQQARVTTDGAGALTAFSFWFVKTPGPPYNVGAGDPNARFDAIYFDQINRNGGINRYCTVRGGNSAASGPESCSTSSPDTNTSSYSGLGPTLTLAAAPVAAVPTLSEWAMILFGLILAGGAALYIQRRRLTA